MYNSACVLHCTMYHPYNVHLCLYLTAPCIWYIVLSSLHTPLPLMHCSTALYLALSPPTELNAITLSSQSSSYSLLPGGPRSLASPSTGPHHYLDVHFLSSRHTQWVLPQLLYSRYLLMPFCRLDILCKFVPQNITHRPLSWKILLMQDIVILKDITHVIVRSQDYPTCLLHASQIVLDKSPSIMFSHHHHHHHEKSRVCCWYLFHS